MKRLLFLFIIIIASLSLSAQFQVGLNGSFETALAKTGGVTTYLTGPGLDISYMLPQEKIVLGLGWQYRWMLEWPNNPTITSYNAYFRLYPFPKKQIRPYLEMGVGYYKSKEAIDFGGGSTFLFNEDGIAVKPSLGVTLPNNLIKNTFIDLGTFYQFYSDSHPSGIGVDFAIRYILR